MARIELEIGGKYSAQQAFDKLEGQMRSVAKSSARGLTLVNSGFSQVLQQVGNLSPGVQQATSALQAFAEMGAKGGGIALVALAVQQVVKKFGELKEASKEMGRQSAEIATYAARRMEASAAKQILAAKAAATDAKLAFAEAK